MPIDFAALRPSAVNPVSEWYVVTPNDGADLPKPVRALRATAAGTIRCTFVTGTTADMNFNAGETRTAFITRVLVTGTTATGIEGGV